MNSKLRVNKKRGPKRKAASALQHQPESPPAKKKKGTGKSATSQSSAPAAKPVRKKMKT